MNRALISDIHGNLEALEAVLVDARAQKCTHFVCLGDIVGYNANPSECVRIIQELECPVVKGNHDEQASIDRSTEGFNELAEVVHRSPKSLMRMLGPRGNPQAKNFFQIVAYLIRHEGIKLELRAAAVRG